MNQVLRALGTASALLLLTPSLFSRTSNGDQIAGNLTFDKVGENIVIASKGGGVTYRAVVDRKAGGDIITLNLPVDGHAVASQLNDIFFYGEHGRQYTLRGWAGQERFPLSCSMSVVSQTPDEIEVQVNTFLTGTFKVLESDPAIKAKLRKSLVGYKDKAVELARIYTFKSDRVLIDDEVRWVAPDVELKNIWLITSFKPGSAQGPAAHVKDPVQRAFYSTGLGGEKVYPGSGGDKLPAGITYPFTAEHFLKNGYKVSIQTLGASFDLSHSDRYCYEKPWQQDWDQLTGFIYKVDDLAAGGVVRLTNEIVFAKAQASEMPPVVTIHSPGIEMRSADVKGELPKYSIGDTIKLAASAINSDGSVVSDNDISWVVHTDPWWNTRSTTLQGANLAYTLANATNEGDKNSSTDRKLLETIYVKAKGKNGTEACETLAVQVGKEGEPTRPTPWDWTTATPESQGMSSQRLNEMRDYLTAHRTSGLLVVRNDKIVCEWYAKGLNATSTHGTASMAKAVVGGVSTAVALSDSRIALDDYAAKFIPEWRNDPRKSRITIRQLGSHTSGLEDAEDGDLPHDKLTGWKGDFWKFLAPPHDPFTISRDVTPMIHEPGEREEYSNPGIALLGYALTSALRDAPEKDLKTLLRDRIMRPVGVPDAEWSVGGNKTPIADGLLMVETWGGARYSARGLARLCRLMLHQGDWEGQQLLSAESVRLVTSDAGTPGTCGIGWWSNNEGPCAAMPRDAYWGLGAGHKVVAVVPSLNLIAIRFGQEIEDVSEGEWARPVYKRFFEPLIQSITDRGAAK